MHEAKLSSPRVAEVHGVVRDAFRRALETMPLLFPVIAPPQSLVSIKFGGGRHSVAVAAVWPRVPSRDFWGDSVVVLCARTVYSQYS